MGLARGIFVVDTHVHGQRHAFKLRERENVDSKYADLGSGMGVTTTYANTDRLLYHMDRYGIDVSVLQPAFAMTNEINKQMIKAHPDRLVSMVWDVETRRKEKETGKWSVDEAVEELRRELDTGLYVGIGEGMPGGHTIRPGGWDARLEEICKIMDLCREYKVMATYHCGFPAGYAGSLEYATVQGHYDHDWDNPFRAGQLAAMYPDVPILLLHSGIEGSGYRTDIYEKCLAVARSHHNLYLECGMWWAELYEKPLKDPNIGCEKLVYGTDWGAASTPQSWMPGCVPETFTNQDINSGLPAHQIDIWGWSLREVGRLNIPQDDLNLILGGNACRLMNIKTPHTRLFKHYIKKDPHHG